MHTIARRSLPAFCRRRSLSSLFRLRCILIIACCSFMNLRSCHRNMRSTARNNGSVSIVSPHICHRFQFHSLIIICDLYRKITSYVNYAPVKTSLIISPLYVQTYTISLIICFQTASLRMRIFFCIPNIIN
jgi:hypothetical protein